MGRDLLPFELDLLIFPPVAVCICGPTDPILWVVRLPVWAALLAERFPGTSPFTRTKDRAMNPQATMRTVRDDLLGRRRVVVGRQCLRSGAAEGCREIRAVHPRTERLHPLREAAAGLREAGPRRVSALRKVPGVVAGGPRQDPARRRKSSRPSARADYRDRKRGDRREGRGSASRPR